MHHRLQVLDAAEIKWEDYLYHYTRSCPGPWPGQSYRLYLESLFDEKFSGGAFSPGNPHSDHGRRPDQGQLQRLCGEIIRSFHGLPCRPRSLARHPALEPGAHSLDL